MVMLSSHSVKALRCAELNTIRNPWTSFIQSSSSTAAMTCISDLNLILLYHNVIKHLKSNLITNIVAGLAIIHGYCTISAEK